MARGESKRIVIEVDDLELKVSLHARLKEERSNLKAWFTEKALEYLQSPRKPAVQLSIKDLLRKGEP